MSSNSQRIKWIDYIRAIAILCVVLSHAIEKIYTFSLDSVMSLTAQSRFFCFTCHTIGRLGVPFFLMITGYLLLPKEYDVVQIKQFWKDKWFHLFICALFWFVIYDVFLITVEHQPISILDFVTDVAFFHKININVAWYLPMILGIYILIPFVAIILKQYGTTMILFPVLIYTYFLFGFPVINLFIRCFNEGASLVNQFHYGFSGGVYGLYLIYGFLVFKGTFKKIKSAIIAFISLICFISAVFLQLWSYSKGILYNVWYDNLLLLIASIGLFELASRLKTEFGYRVIRFISFYSFPLYLTHDIIKDLASKTIYTLPIMKPIQVLLLWVCCILFGTLISIVISKIPKVGCYLLYIKNRKNT